MAWLLTICNNETDTTTIDRELTGNRRYSKLDRHTLEQHEEEITRLKQELQEEQERSEQLTRSNDALSIQIESLQKRVLGPDNDNTPQNNSQLQQLLTEKESQLAQIQASYNQSQKKVNELQHELEESKQSYQSQLAQTQQTFDDLQKKYSAMEKQRDDLLTKVMANSGGDTIAQLNKENEMLKDERNELEEKLNHETRRADVMQQSLDTKANEITRLEDEVDRLRTKVQSLGGGDQYKVMITTETGTSSKALLQINSDADEEEDEYDTDAAYEDEKGEFDELKYLSTGPTVIGVDADIFDAAAYAVKVNKAIDTMRNNPKERIHAAVTILMECNAEQRKAIANVKADVTLESKFSLYSSNKKVLKLLADIMKSQSECDAEWMHQAIRSKNDSVVIEILFTRTNAQIEAFTQQYARLYEKELAKDIEAAFVRKDAAFVKMCATLIALDQRRCAVVSRKEVNKKWAKNDGKRLKGYLMDNNNSDKAWDALYELVVSRSWTHLDQMERAFNHETKVALTYQLKKANPNKCIARKAVMAVLEAAHSMHELFASYLQQALKKKKDDALQRVLLSRSEIDLADIDCAFTNNEQFGDSKTTRVWIENSTQSSLYRFILLSLLGLHDHDTERMETIRDRVLVRAPTKINIATPRMYKGALVKYNPSIIAANSFDVAQDANDIATWIKTGDAKVLKEKLAGLLPARNAKQRGEILAEYPKVMDDLTKVIKKGQVVTLTDGFLKPSIAAYDAVIIEKCLNDNNVTTIGDILCTRNNAEIEEIIDAYKQTRYKAADLAQKVADLCEKNKSGSVRIILDSLLRCKRSEKKKEKVDTKAVASDVEFLINTKKFKAAEKERFVQIFCANNWKYIRAINRQFGMKSSMNLEKLIKDKLGSGDGPGYFTSILLKYSCDPTEYFAQKLFELGAKFDKNKEEIARIFLTRSETDLNGIRARFVKTPYGKQLDAWVEDKGKGSRFGLFLMNILTSIDHHNAMFDGQSMTVAVDNDDLKDYKPVETVESPTAALSSDNDSMLDVSESGGSKASKLKYGDESVQNGILNNVKRKEESLALLASSNGGLIKFLQKYLKSKIVTKMFAKLDSEKKGYIEMSSFPDLIAFVVILYKVKLHQQKTKTKTKPKLDNQAVRSEVEHLAIWIAKRHVYDKNGFKLSQDEFQNKFGVWCQDYIDNKGVLAM